jgi:hypothetical protein
MNYKAFFAVENNKKHSFSAFSNIRDFSLPSTTLEECIKQPV